MANFLLFSLFFCPKINAENIDGGTAMTETEYQNHRQTVQQKVSLFMELIHCSYPLDYWCYSNDGHYIYSTSENARILDLMLSVSKIKEAIMKHGQTHSMPLIISSSLENIWIVVYEHKEDMMFYHVLGPLFADTLSQKQLQAHIDSYAITLVWKKEFERLVHSFPVIPWSFVTQYTIMLHYLVTGEKILVSDFTYLGEDGSTTSRTTSEKREEDTPDDPAAHSNSIYLAEQDLLNNIRHGNLNYKEALSNASHFSSGIKIKTGNPLRQAKDSGVVFCALCARAAIEGGLSPDTAYGLQNIYTQRIEGCDAWANVAEINHQMYTDFIDRVHRLKLSGATTPQIRQCIDFIQNHLEEDIPLSALAASLGYTEYYLSRKFKSELGISINQYIRSEKIRRAKDLLCQTGLSIQEISDRLSFCSRSYFTDVFLKSCEVTPSEYRNRYKKG